MIKRLFLLGGGPAFAVYADEFVQVAGGSEAKIAALVGSVEGWQNYGDGITSPWKERGVTQIFPIMPGTKGSLEVDAALAALHTATGIFIGGGSTPVYHRLYARGAIGDMIRKRYAAGIPVAGVSAGALISMELCQPVPCLKMGSLCGC